MNKYIVYYWKNKWNSYEFHEDSDEIAIERYEKDHPRFKANSFLSKFNPQTGKNDVIKRMSFNQ